MMDMGGLTIGKGEFMAAVGAIALAISTILSKVTLKQIPLGLFSIIRTTLGTVVFFIAVLILYTPTHFIDVFAPFLWQWMLVYGAIIVVGGQLCWFTGLKTTGAADVSLASSFSPIAGISRLFDLIGNANNSSIHRRQHHFNRDRSQSNGVFRKQTQLRASPSCKSGKRDGYGSGIQRDLMVNSLALIKGPPCNAVTSIGECLNYLFDADNDRQNLVQFFRRIYPP
jgi:uncharacterized membrane protein